MKLTEVTYGATLNLGNYESGRLDLRYQLESNETVLDARKEAFKVFKDEAGRVNAKDSRFMSLG